MARQLYDAWGNVRYVTGTLPTDVTFTGQRSNLDQIGLYYFKARFYASSLGRFVSADTIVPQPGNPQALNRYAYELNNPVKYQDPSGHMPTDGCQTEGCATDEDWAENFIKGILHTTDLTDPNDNPKGQLTLHFYQWTLDHYTPEAGPITPGDVLRDAWHAAATHVKASGLSPAQDLEQMRRMGVVLDIGVVMGATALTQRWKATGYAFLESYYRTNSLASSIANGHAYNKHVLQKGEFPEINNRSEFADYIHDIMRNPDEYKVLTNGRAAYWKNGTVVITNPLDVDGGTAFRPAGGWAYFDNLK